MVSGAGFAKEVLVGIKFGCFLLLPLFLFLFVGEGLYLRRCLHRLLSRLWLLWLLWLLVCINCAYFISQGDKISPCRLAPRSKLSCCSAAQQARKDVVHLPRAAQPI